VLVQMKWKIWREGMLQRMLGHQAEWAPEAGGFRAVEEQQRSSVLHRAQHARQRGEVEAE